MKEKVNSILIQIYKDSYGEEPKFEIVPEMNLRNDFGLDSFSLAELTVYIEDEFGTDIFEEGIINTVGEIYNKLS